MILDDQGVKSWELCRTQFCEKFEVGIDERRHVKHRRKMVRLGQFPLESLETWLHDPEFSALQLCLHA